MDWQISCHDLRKGRDMALLEINYYSKMLAKSNEFHVIIPDRILESGQKECNVLWFLHAGGEDSEKVLRCTNVENYAVRHGFVVVLPSVEGSFYSNMQMGRYLDYVTLELPAYLSDLLGLVFKKENSIAAGGSMGGFGSWKLGFTHPELYAAVAPFSGGSILKADFGPAFDEPHKRRFGTANLTKLAGTQYDLLHLARQAAASGQDLPVFYTLCGTEDAIAYDAMVETVEYCKELGMRVLWQSLPGGHSYDLWDPQLEKFMIWFLEHREEIRV